ncbi:MAG: succinate dehydrogenase/fumarate reductase transmembrane subunit [Bellilinea sp.]
MRESLSPKRLEGSGRWLLKILTGLLIVIFLGIHFVVNHLVAPGGLLTYADVVAYFQNPVIVVMEISFLVLAVVHSFLGLRSILLDLNPSPTVLRMANFMLVVIGTAAIIYGIWLALTIASRG